jgi:hypothetical protein
MKQQVANSALLIISFFGNCVLLVGDVNARKSNDTRAALGLSQQEVLALHRELRSLVDIHTAPSSREEEIQPEEFHGRSCSFGNGLVG